MLSLFSGIGGFETAARYVWPDIEIVAMCEREPFCRQVLEKHFPGVPIVEDVNDVETIAAYATGIRRDGLPEWGFGETEAEGVMQKSQRGDIQLDIICGGPPCQPASHAGKRQGASDDRWLWPQTLAVMEAIHPHWCVFENPTGFLTLNGGLEFESVCARLEGQGYWVEAFVLPASATGAPHRRDRIWIIANSDAERRGRRENDQGQESAKGDRTQIANRDAQNPTGERCRPWWSESERQQGRLGLAGTDCADVADTESKRLGETREYFERSQEWIAGIDGIAPDTHQQGLPPREMQPGDGGEEQSAIIRNPWNEHWYAAAARFCGISHGISRGVDRHRTARLRALGNAIVPQVAIRIFEAIKRADEMKG